MAGEKRIEPPVTATLTAASVQAVADAVANWQDSHDWFPDGDVLARKIYATWEKALQHDATLADIQARLDRIEALLNPPGA